LQVSTPFANRDGQAEGCFAGPLKDRGRGF